ncbi:MAG TPA: hypothetical protein VFR76_08790, partial [Verrucomicrobiae bacterium]|nr:hypothetical protein [Verrucomicrobiae bacterium]
WATDRWFGGRRVPVIAALLMTLGLLALVYDSVIQFWAGCALAGALVIACLWKTEHHHRKFAADSPVS